MHLSRCSGKNNLLGLLRPGCSPLLCNSYFQQVLSHSPYGYFRPSCHPILLLHVLSSLPDDLTTSFMETTTLSLKSTFKSCLLLYIPWSVTHPFLLPSRVSVPLPFSCMWVPSHTFSCLSRTLQTPMITLSFLYIHLSTGFFPIALKQNLHSLI